MAIPGPEGSGSYLHEVVVRPIEVFVQLNNQTLEEGRELSLLLARLWERNRDLGGRTGAVGADEQGVGGAGQVEQQASTQMSL